MIAHPPTEGRHGPFPAVQTSAVIGDSFCETPTAQSPVSRSSSIDRSGNCPDLSVSGRSHCGDNETSSFSSPRSSRSQSRDGISRTVRSDSWSSIKEDRGGLAQSFLISLKRTRDCLDAQSCLCPAKHSGASSPDWCTCCSRVWELRSGSPPRSISGDDSEADQGETVSQYHSRLQSQRTREQRSLSAIEAFPSEILEQIIGELSLDAKPNEWTPRNVHLTACLRTCKTFYAATLRTLYRKAVFTTSKAFSKFATQIDQFPELGRMVRRLDLSHLSSLGLCRTMQANAEIQDLTATSLLRVLKATPRIQEALFQYHMAQDVDKAVLQKLWYGLPELKALDFCASADASFVEAFSSSLNNLRAVPSLRTNIQRLSLHHCFTLHSADLELLLSRLPHIQVLDLHHTRVTGAGLHAIPESARLTHLNLGRCTFLSGPAVVAFLSDHPAARELVHLNLCADLSVQRLLWRDDVEELLPRLPSSLRSLNLNGAQISTDQLPALIPLTKHLEELGLSYAELSMADIMSIFRPSSSSSSTITNSVIDHGGDTLMTDAGEDTPAPAPAPAWEPSTLHYIDLTGVKTLTQSALSASAAGAGAGAGSLLSSLSAPLEVIEVSEQLGKALMQSSSSPATRRKHGWVAKELGRRYWYVRENKPRGSAWDGDDGSREWKLGSRWWGMRKCPVASAEVGGIYGHYMYKK